MKKLAVLLALSFTTAVFAQSDPQKAFEKLKTLAGTWEGRMTTTPSFANVEGTKTTVTMRVTSMGHVLMHEMVGEGRPDDPITMFYLDAERLALTHFCDAGNRPRMTGKVSADGKTIEFDFLDITGSTKYGHMRRAVFTFLDDGRHVEEWTFMMPGDKPVVARVELKRTAAAAAAPPAGPHKH